MICVSLEEQLVVTQPARELELELFFEISKF